MKKILMCCIFCWLFGNVSFSEFAFAGVKTHHKTWGENFIRRPAIKISPSSEIVLGDVVSIQLIGLKANEKYELKADLVDEWGRLWRSTAVFLTGKTGKIDLSKDAVIEGDYTGVDPWGMFWSAKPQTPQPNTGREDISAAVSIVTFTLSHDDQVVATQQLKRWMYKPTVRRTEIRENGLVGDLYESNVKGRRPTIVVLGGSGGGIMWQRRMAGLLASHGYTALALAYFRMGELPQGLDRYPLEYFGNAINRLKERPSVDRNCISVMGQSFGGELAVLLGSQFEDISSVIAYSPSFVVFQSYASDSPNTSKWSYQGKEFPFVPTKFDNSLTGLQNWTNILSNTEAVNKAVIPVERTKGAILLISGKADQVWHSTPMADKIIDRLKTSNFKYNYQHLAYEDAGHALAQAGSMPTIEAVNRNNNGGTAKGTGYAQADSWQNVLKFLKDKSCK